MPIINFKPTTGSLSSISIWVDGSATKLQFPDDDIKNWFMGSPAYGFWVYKLDCNRDLNLNQILIQYGEYELKGKETTYRIVSGNGDDNNGTVVVNDFYKMTVLGNELVSFMNDGFYELWVKYGCISIPYQNFKTIAKPLIDVNNKKTDNIPNMGKLKMKAILLRLQQIENKEDKIISKIDELTTIIKDEIQARIAESNLKIDYRTPETYPYPSTQREPFIFGTSISTEPLTYEESASTESVKTEKGDPDQDESFYYNFYTADNKENRFFFPNKECFNFFKEHIEPFWRMKGYPEWSLEEIWQKWKEDRLRNGTLDGKFE